jgi:hypothetical protein
VGFFLPRDNSRMRTAGFAVISNPAAIEPALLAQGPDCWKRLTIKWEALVEFVVPLGYQDETGFHYGTPPEESLAHEGRVFCDYAL